MNLPTALIEISRQYPENTALVCDGQRLMYRQWTEQAARLGAVLVDQDLIPGDRVALLATNSNHYAVALTGIWWMGGVACPINTRWSVPEIAFSLRDCDAQTLIIDQQYAPLVPQLRSHLPELRTVFCLGDDDSREMFPLQPLATRARHIDAIQVSDEELAALLYTGGTTGRPKGVMLSHSNLQASARARIAVSPALDDSVALIAMPLFHIAGLGRLLTQQLTAARSVIMAQFRIDAVIDLIESEGVTDLTLAPTMLQTLLDDRYFDLERLRSVRRFVYGAAPIADSLLERLARQLPHVRFSHVYGLTECAGLATMSPYRALPSRSAGPPRGTEVRIVDPDGRVLSECTVGEIVLRGPNVMSGYWNRPEDTALALREGWLHTGDAGYLDEDGDLHVVDRIKDMIITGGENVYPVEIESVLLQHPAVHACAVFGFPSARWGEAVHAVVVLRPDATADEPALRLHCRSHLAGYKCPKHIEFDTSLPMTSAGKIAKHLLRHTSRSPQDP